MGFYNVLETPICIRGGVKLSRNLFQKGGYSKGTLNYNVGAVLCKESSFLCSLLFHKPTSVDTQQTSGGTFYRVEPYRSQSQATSALRKVTLISPFLFALLKGTNASWYNNIKTGWCQNQHHNYSIVPPGIICQN